MPRYSPRWANVEGASAFPDHPLPLANSSIRQIVVCGACGGLVVKDVHDGYATCPGTQQRGVLMRRTRGTETQGYHSLADGGEMTICLAG